MKKLLLSMLFVVSGSAAEQTNTTVVPRELANTEGNSSLALFSGLVPEYQQLFRSSALETEWQTPVKITGMSFRINAGGGSFDAVIPRIEVRLSTSARAPEQMSTSYAINRGPDETTVYARSDVRFVSPDGPGPRPFHLNFQFDTPFTYDPSAGHLLMFFANDATSPPISRPVDAHGYSDINSSPFGAFFERLTNPNPIGAVTQFEWVAIPEPGPSILLVIGCALICIKKRRTA